MKDGRSHIFNVSYLRHQVKDRKDLALGQSGCRGSEFEGLMWAGVVDPDFGGDGLQREADPKGRAEEFGGLRFVAAQQRGGKEGSDDGADAGDGKSDSVAANHPLTMLRELAAERVPERLRERN